MIPKVIFSILPSHLYVTSYDRWSATGCFGEIFQAVSPETYAAHARKWYKECLGDPIR